MPGATVNIGTGTLLTFATTGFTAELIESVNWSGISRANVPTYHMRSTQAGAGQVGGQTFMPTKYADPGSITLTVHFSPDTNVPIHAAPETIRCTFPLVTGDATAAYWECTGFITEMGPSIPLEGVMVNNITVKMSGLISFYDAT